jgi:hypothetical protein
MYLLIIPHVTKLCGYNVFDPSVRLCVLICCRLNNAYVCWSIYTKVLEIVSNNSKTKSMDGIDFQKNLSRGSLLWEGDLVKFVSWYVVTWIVPTFVEQYTRNFGKLSVIVKAWIGLIFRKICQEDHFFGKGT